MWMFDIDTDGTTDMAAMHRYSNGFGWSKGIGGAAIFDSPLTNVAGTALSSEFPWTGNTVGDISGDGFDDILFWTAKLATRDLVYIRSGSPPTLISIAPNHLALTNSPTSGLIVDLDGDGDQDVLVYRLIGGITAFLNLDTLGTSWSAPTSFPVPPVMELATPRCVYDLDGNGFRDIIFVTEGSVGVGFKNASSLAISHTSPLFPLSGTSVENSCQDMTGDGIPDVFGILSGLTLYLFQIRGLTRHGKLDVVPVVVSFPTSINFKAASDLNRDGIIDWVFTKPNNPEWHHVIQGPGGIFPITQTYTVGCSTSHRAAAGVVHSDGYPTIVLGTFNYNCKFALHLPAGSVASAFDPSESQLILASLPSSPSLTLPPFALPSSDGIQDLIIVSHNGSFTQLNVLLNSPTAPGWPGSLPLSSPLILSSPLAASTPLATAVRDVNGDFALDPVLLLSDGTVLSFPSPVSAQPSALLLAAPGSVSSPTSLAFADVTGNGLDDLLLGSSSDGAVYTFAQSAPGVFASSSPTLLVPGPGGGGPTGIHLATGLFHGPDTLVDLLVLTTADATLRVFPSLAGPSVTIAPTPMATAPDILLVADVNDDGLTDLIVGDSGSGTVLSLTRASPSGAYTLADTLSLPGMTHLALAELDKTLRTGDLVSSPYDSLRNGDDLVYATADGAFYLPQTASNTGDFDDGDVRSIDPAGGVASLGAVPFNAYLSGLPLVVSIVPSTGDIVARYQQSYFDNGIPPMRIVDVPVAECGFTTACLASALASASSSSYFALRLPSGTYTGCPTPDIPALEIGIHVEIFTFDPTTQATGPSASPAVFHCPRTTGPSGVETAALRVLPNTKVTLLGPIVFSGYSGASAAIIVDSGASLVASHVSFQAESSHAVLALDAASVALDACSLSSSSSTLVSGTSLAEAVITSSTFDGRSAVACLNLGSRLLRETEYVLTNVTMTRCTNPTGSGGGAAFSGNPVVVQLTNVSVSSSHTPEGGGGGLYLDLFGTASRATLRGVSVSSSSARGPGGGILILARESSVVDSSGLSLLQNSASFGGGMAVIDGSLVPTSLAPYFGFATSAPDPGPDGCVTCASSEASLEFGASGTWSANTATYGGALFVCNTGVVVGERSFLAAPHAGNMASRAGGAVFTCVPTLCTPTSDCTRGSPPWVSFTSPGVRDEVYGSGSVGTTGYGPGWATRASDSAIVPPAISLATGIQIEPNVASVVLRDWAGSMVTDTTTRFSTETSETNVLLSSFASIPVSPTGVTGLQGVVITVLSLDIIGTTMSFDIVVGSASDEANILGSGSGLRASIDVLLETCPPGTGFSPSQVERVGTDEFSGTCRACAAGSAARQHPELGIRICETCGPGALAFQEGLDECVFCPALSDTVTNLSRTEYTLADATRNGTYTLEPDDPFLFGVACPCIPGTWAPERRLGGTCVYCPRFATCAGGLDIPLALEGYYDISPEHSEFSRCRRPRACAGGRKICYEGNEGFMCGTCAEGYYSDATNACALCPPGNAILFYVGLSALVLAGFVFTFVSLKLSSAYGSSRAGGGAVGMAYGGVTENPWERSSAHSSAGLVAGSSIELSSGSRVSTSSDSSDASSSEWGSEQEGRVEGMPAGLARARMFRLRRGRPLLPVSAAIGVLFLQAVSLIAESRLIFPGSVERTLAALSVFNLSMEFFAAECTLGSFEGRYIAGLAVPAIFLGSVVVAGLCAVVVRAVTFRGLLFVAQRVLFVVGPTVFIPIARAPLILFDCTQLPNGDFVLDADQGRRCYDSRWFQLFPLGLFAVLVYIVLFPAFVTVRLYWNRTNLNEVGSLTQFGAMYRLYRSQLYFFEVVLLAKRFAFVTAALFLSDISVWLVVSMLGIFVTSLCVDLYTGPWIRAFHTRLDAVLSLCGMVFLIAGFVYDAIQDDSGAAASLSQHHETTETGTIVIMLLALGVGVVAIAAAIVLEVTTKVAMERRKGEDVILVDDDDAVVSRAVLAFVRSRVDDVEVDGLRERLVGLVTEFE